MTAFRLIPIIYAGDLPSDVEKELMNWNDELCFHGDGGCVFYLWAEEIEALPLFTNWMINIGAWSRQDIDLPSYHKFVSENNIVEIHRDYVAYHKWCGSRPQYLTVAMTGT